MKDSSSQTAGMRCYAVCDPHMKLFGVGQTWEGQFFTGEFILYRNTHTDTEVQPEVEYIKYLLYTIVAPVYFGWDID